LRGRELFRKCVVCHTVVPGGANRAGPRLWGVFGRRAGSVADFNYSAALRDSDIVWTEETIGRLFEIGPERLTPGSKMPLQRMADPRDRAELLGYLKQVTGGAVRQGTD
jgi:cytochrome c